MTDPATISRLPPLSAYEAWLSAHDGRTTGRNRLTPAQYRRIAMLHRIGEDWTAIARVVGKNDPRNVRDAWARMPEALK